MKPKCGDIVYIDVAKGENAKSMTHFDTKFVGVCGLNYKQQYGGRDEDEWSIYHPTRGRISWYNTDQIEVLKSADDAMELNARRLDDYRNSKANLKAIKDHIGNIKK